MQGKAQPSIVGPELDGLPSLVQAYVQWAQLKQLYRQGWLRHGVSPDQCESVAEHSFAVALLTLTVMDDCFPELDHETALIMALLHDVGEVYVGDLTPADGVSAAEKHRREREAVVRVLGGLEGAQAYIDLWDAYVRGDTPEARLVREVDRLEMGLQAYLYEQQGPADLAEFYASVREGLSLPALSRLFRQVEEQRESKCESRG
jgi:putative hydrolase of HD superfamily